MALPEKPSERGRLWTLDYIFDLLTAHFGFVSYSSLFTIVPPYVLERGGEEWQLGLVVGSFGVVGLLIRPFAGRWVVSFGTKRVAIAGVVILGVASFLYIPAFNVWLLIPVRMLQGVGLAIAPVATSAIVANLAPARRRAEGMAYMGNSIGVSNLYAPVFAYFLLKQLGFEAAFLFSGIAGMLAAAFALMLSARRTAFPITPETSRQIVPLISRGALFPTLVFLGYTITTAPVNTFLPLLAEERGLGNPGLFFTVNSSTSIIAMFFSGPIADRLGRASVIMPGLLSAAAAMNVLMIASNQLVFLAAAFLTGAGFGLLQPGIQSLTVDRVPPRERGSALATLQSAWDIGGSGGAFALGPIAGVVGTAATFGIVGAGTLASLGGFVVRQVRTGRKPASRAVEPAE
ncbi:MAG: MFS transporter [Chloroflexi bacterium]|nr:MFS transporter [Chloroflexota bacterium]